MLTFRFDDIYADLPAAETLEMISEVREHRVILAVSPLWVRESGGYRLFPKAWKPLSNVGKYMECDRMGLPVAIMDGASRICDNLVLASHGLVHCDHRLLDISAQAMSIVVSCSLVGAKCFVPPFNYWDDNTEEICRRYGIELVKYEHGWRCAEYETYDQGHDLWYTHSRNFTPRSWRRWLEGKA